MSGTDPEMSAVREIELLPGAAWAGAVKRGHCLRVKGMTGASLVCFNAADLTERFDQARTKVYNMRIWMSAGEQLYSKLNNPMMTMTADGFAPEGRHDLQYGMTSRTVLVTATREGRPARWAHLEGKTVPGRGTLEALAEALKPWGIAEHDMPMPLNLFHHTVIDTATGVIGPSPVRPVAPVAVDLRTEMDLVVALAACLDLEAPAGAVPVRLAVLSA
jgi:uncharacterized protein YcgI (DUF1989 family)